MPTPPSKPTKLPSATTALAEQLKKKLEKHRAVIAKERDALREVLEDYENLVNDLDEADTALEDYENLVNDLDEADMALEDAVKTLSRLQ